MKTKLSSRGYAQHRKALGLPGTTHKAVQRALADGRIHADAEGLIDPGVADREWHANTDASKRPGPSGDESFEEARRRKEIALANLREDEVRKNRGELVSAANLGNRLRDVFTQCKTKLLGIPVRARQQLPHLSVADVGVLDSLVREALEDLADGRFEVRS
jgi:hypothetical protein